METGKPARPGSHIPIAARAGSGPQHGIPAVPDGPANLGMPARVLQATDAQFRNGPRRDQTRAVDRNN